MSCGEFHQISPFKTIKSIVSSEEIAECQSCHQWIKFSKEDISKIRHSKRSEWRSK